MGTYTNLLKMKQTAPTPEQQPPQEVVVAEFSPPLPVPPPPTKITPEQASRPSGRTEIRSEKRSVSLPYKRKTKRYSFEFYEDQLQTLKKLKIEAEMCGEMVSQSDIVREAIDAYLSKKKRTPTE